MADQLIPKVYIQAGVAVAIHPEGLPYLHTDLAVHGVAPGAVLTGGVRLGPTVAVELEADVERSTTTRLRYEYLSVTASCATRH